MWHTNDGMGWWMIFMGFFWILFWASIIYLFVTAFARRDGHVHRSGGDEADAMEIARRRLASGEISPEQFQEIRRHLDADRRGSAPS